MHAQAERPPHGDDGVSRVDGDSASSNIRADPRHNLHDRPAVYLEHRELLPVLKRRVALEEGFGRPARAAFPDVSADWDHELVFDG
jgi:hypothetical protein